MSTETTNKKIKIDNGTTFGRTYTDKAVDAKLPTDLIASANKLSLGVGNAPLGSGVNLSGFTYDEATKTLKAEGSGATLPAGTKDDPFHINHLEYYSDRDYSLKYNGANYTYLKTSFNPTDNYGLNIELSAPGGKLRLPLKIHLHGGYNSIGFKLDAGGINFSKTPKGQFRIYNYNNYDGDMFIPVLQHPSTDGKYLLQITRNNEYSYHYDWVAGGTNTYNHYIVISDGTASNAIYMLIPSANSLICSSLPELNTLLGNTNRFIQASGVVTDATSKLPIVAINWQGSFPSSKIVTISSEEATTKFTDISDIVEPA